MEARRIGSIPQRYQPGIAKLISLQDDSIKELLLTLDDVPSSFNLDRLKSQIIPKLRTIPANDASSIIETLESLHSLQLSMELPLSDFVEQLCSAMEASNNDALKLDTDSRERFKDHLTRLLHGKLLSISAKAQNVFLEHERIFGRTRILTDVRSIFESNVDEHLVAGIIVHTLRIHYIEGQQHKDFFVTLDTADMAVLIDLLKRAQEKVDVLKSTLASANVPYIDAD